MADIIANRAKRYLDSIDLRSLELISSELNSEILNYTRYNDRYRFLSILRKGIAEQIENHVCTRPGGCTYERDREVALFVIDQEIEQTAQFLEPINSDAFSAAEQVEMMGKINEIIDRLKQMESAQSAGMEVLYEELEELKMQTNIGKKNFRQLLWGKVAESVASKAIDATVGDMIYNSIKEGVGNIPVMLGFGS